MADWTKRFTVQYTVFMEAEVQRDTLEEAKNALINYERTKLGNSTTKKIKNISFGMCTEFPNNDVEKHPA